MTDTPRTPVFDEHDTTLVNAVAKALCDQQQPRGVWVKANEKFRDIFRAEAVEAIRAMQKVTAWRLPPAPPVGEK